MEKLSSNLENRIVRYDEAVDPEQLTAHPLNFRRHPIVQRKALRASIEGHGWVAPVIATVDGTVIDGHARVEEALSSGVTVPVVYVDMDEDEAGSMILRLDPIAAMATHDSDVLSELLSDEEWTDQEDTLRDVLDELAATPTDIGIGDTPSGADDVPESVEAISKPGDVWLLRSEHGMVHRVICGDSTDAQDVDTLMGGTAAVALVNADPPYGMNLEADYTKLPNMAKGKKYEPVIGDDRPFDMRTVCVPDHGEAVWWGADYYRDTIASGGSWYVWDKRAADGSQDAVIGNHFELAWSPKKHRRLIFRYPWTAFDKKWSHEGAHHPTQKPVKMIAELLVLLTDPGDTVYDPFLGSGSTLIAAELEQRTCYGIELSPAYVDIICARWQGLTGIMPEHADTGEIHDFIGNP